MTKSYKLSTGDLLDEVDVMKIPDYFACAVLFLLVMWAAAAHFQA